VAVSLIPLLIYRLRKASWKQGTTPIAKTGS